MKLISLGALVFQAGYHPRKKTFKAYAYPKHEFFRRENMPHAFFLTFRHLLSKICQYDQKHTLFTPIFASFCTPIRCTSVHCLVLKNNPNYVKGFFFPEDDIQLQIQVPPPGFVVTPGLGCHSTHEHVCLWGYFNPTFTHYMCALSPLFYTGSEAPRSISIGIYNILVYRTTKTHTHTPPHTPTPHTPPSPRTHTHK